MTGKQMMNTNERLKNFWEFLMEWEGRTYEHDPDDPGGETRFGIDKRSHPSVDIKALTEGEAFDIYAKEWEADGCEKLPSPMAEVFFDTAVNCGLRRANEFLAAFPSARGIIGARETYYRHLAEIHPTMRKFLRGWLNRTAALDRWRSAHV
jgi:lysozyme family protein